MKVFIGIRGGYLKSKFGEFAYGMQKFYDNGKIVYWLESHNIKYPTNEIGEPPMEINTGIQSGPVGQGLSEINSNGRPLVNENDDINTGLKNKE